MGDSYLGQLSRVPCVGRVHTSGDVGWGVSLEPGPAVWDLSATSRAVRGYHYSWAQHDRSTTSPHRLQRRTFHDPRKTRRYYTYADTDISPFIYYMKPQQTTMNDYGRAVENTHLHVNNNNKNTKRNFKTSGIHAHAHTRLTALCLGLLKVKNSCRIVIRYIIEFTIKQDLSKFSRLNPQKPRTKSSF